MEALRTTLDEIYFYFDTENKTVWKIAPYKTSESESCAKKGVTSVTDNTKEVLVPSFTVTKGGETTTYYLTNFISVGDTCTEGVFYKHTHITPGGGQNINTYYSTLCSEQIKASIKNNLELDFNSFNNNRSYLGVLEFMISGAEGYTVEGVNQVTFDETTFDGYKSTDVQSKAWDAANETAKKYGYKVTLEKTSLTIAKNTD